MRLQSAIFDMDGTLLDSMHIWNDVGPKTLRSMGIEPAPDLGPRLMLTTFRDGAALCKEEYRLSESVEEIMDLTKDRVRSFYEHEVQAKPGVEKFLSLLKMEGVWMYVATNTDRDLVEASIRLVKEQHISRIRLSAEDRVEDRLRVPEERARQAADHNREDHSRAAQDR